MSWNDIKGRIKDGYETRRDYVVEHPVKTAVVILGLSVTGYGAYKYFAVPLMQVAMIESHRKATHHIASVVTEASYLL